MFSTDKKYTKDKEYSQKIQSQNRIFLPRDWVKKMNLKEGDYIILQERLNGLCIIPAEVVPRD